MAVLVVVLIRLLVPLTILRWPLAGATASLLVDAFDVVMVDLIAGILGEAPEFGPHYAALDKWLDTYYLAIEAYVASRWSDRLLRRAALALFTWRVVGVLLLEVTGIREILVFFPNLFENFFIYILVATPWFSRLVPRTLPQLALLLLILYIPKAIQEWVLHGIQVHPWQVLQEIWTGMPGYDVRRARPSDQRERRLLGTTAQNHLPARSSQIRWPG